MKTDKVRYILEICEKFKVTNLFGKKFRFNKNNDDRVYFLNEHFELILNKGGEHDDEFYEVYYCEVKSIEVLE